MAAYPVIATLGSSRILGLCGPLIPTTDLISQAEAQAAHFQKTMKQSRRQRTMISAAVLLARRHIAPATAFIGTRGRPCYAPSLYRHHVTSSIPIVARASSTDSTANTISTEPTLEQTLSAATYVKAQLDSIVNSGRRDLSSAPRQEMLLNDLHSIASTLLEYDANSEAADLFRYSLDEFDPTNIAVRERLSAALRAMGSMEESARELYRVIHTLEEEIKSQDQMGMVGAETGESLSWLYLDLGGLVEEIQPLPGAGPSWDVSIQTEAEAPKVTLEFDSELEDGFTISLDDDDGDEEEKHVLSDNGKAKGIQKEVLSAIDCYRRAISYNDDNGSAHKRLADALAVIGQNAEALEQFEVAAKLMPADICCATHTFYGKNLDRQIEKEALPMAEGLVSKFLDDLERDTDGLLQNDEAKVSEMAAAFERDGVIVLPAIVSQDDCDRLLSRIDDTILKATTSGFGTDDTVDFTDETRAAANRVHLALPLKEDHADILSAVFCKLHPLLRKILNCSGDVVPLLGSGFMRTSPGARGQELHKDVHHYDRHLPVDDMPAGASINLGEPRCVSIQLQLTDTSSGSGDLGSLEVLPGSHRPDIPNGRPSAIEKAVKDSNFSNGVIPVDVPAGTVTIYSSRLWHRGGPNDSSDAARTFAFFTVTEPDSLAPPGLIHTLKSEDIGEWIVSEDGLSRQE